VTSLGEGTLQSVISTLASAWLKAEVKPTSETVTPLPALRREGSGK